MNRPVEGGTKNFMGGLSLGLHGVNPLNFLKSNNHWITEYENK